MKNVLLILFIFLVGQSLKSQVGTHIENGTEITSDSSFTGHLLLGLSNDVSMALDKNDIQVRNMDVPGSTLFLNRYAGNINAVGGNSSGLFLIGANSGNHKLTVNVDGTDGISIDGDGTGNARLRISNGGGNHFLFDDNAANNVFKMQSATGLSFVINGGDEVMRIAPSQKVLFGSTIEIDHKGLQNGGQIFIKDSEGSDRVKIYATADVSDRGGLISLFNDNDNRTIRLQAHDSQKAGRIDLADSSGTINIKIDADWNGTGDSRIITDEIQIEGGSDLAERFEITNTSEDIMPGYLVSLDPQHEGKLMITKQAYDKKIVGVVSGANGIKPGILMGQAGTEAYGDDLVTLSGRTYIKANNSNGAIMIGDFVTSSKIAGEAMKATKKKKSYGALIGKAMSNMVDGSGFILVLVNLQ